MHIFVGYDSREHVCFQVLEYNLRRWSHTVHPIKHRELRDAGKFNREWLTRSDGQFIDGRDLKPFSTEFSHTRFAAIPMARELGITDWCMFVDCDFMFLSDPLNMLSYVDKKDHASIACIQYEWKEKEGLKMDGMLQLLYHRKLWSSLFLFKPDHPDHDEMTFQKLNWETGASLHAFSWVSDINAIPLPQSWNYIPNFTDPATEPNAIHWSYGGPWMPGFAGVEYADKWRMEYHRCLQYMAAEKVALDPALVEFGRIL